MANINLSDKFSKEKPSLTIGDKTYPVEDSLEAVTRFEEILTAGGGSGMIVQAIESVLGKKAVKELNVQKMAVGNIQTLMLGCMAVMQNLTFEEAQARFLGNR